jgi:hypothetical protein
MRSFLLLLLITVEPLAACASSGHGESIYTSDVSKLLVKSEGSGGFLPSHPPNPDCFPESQFYTLTIAGHQLDWHACEAIFTDTTVTYIPHAGSGKLEDAAWSALQPKLAALVVSDQHTCGEDKPQVAVIVTTAAGDVEYRDDFNACQDRSRPYVASAGLDAALDALGDLARK